MKEIPNQIFVATQEDKEACQNFPMAKKLRRIWLTTQSVLLPKPELIKTQ